MRKIITILALLSISVGFSQEKEVLITLPITDYILEEDSIVIVQVKAPAAYGLREKQLGLISRLENGNYKDISYSKCYLIKGDYYYFAFEKPSKGYIKPEFGDLLFTNIKRNNFFEGFGYDLQKHNIRLVSIYDEEFYPAEEFLSFTPQREKELINLFLEDIKFTGKSMEEQGDDQNYTITKGKFAGKNLFRAMMESSTSDVEKFLNYVQQNPSIYANQTFKISEIYATWLSRGNP